MSNPVQAEAIREPATLLNGVSAMNGVLGTETGKWRSRFWDNERHVALQFSTTAELDGAIDWLWTEAALREMPRVHVGQNTMIVPAEAVNAFRTKGFQFVVGQVTPLGDLPPEEANRIRRTG